jgi:hypothetical protein
MNIYPQVGLKVGAEYDEDAQAGSFMNATLQSAGDEIAFSIATTVMVPGIVVAQGLWAVAHYINETLHAASQVSEGLSFEAQVGPSGDAVDDSDD